MIIRRDVEETLTEMEEHVAEPDSPKPRRFRDNLLTSSEGHVLLIGIGVLLLYTIWLGYKFLRSPDEFYILIGMTVFDVVCGRAAAMAHGYARSLKNELVLPVCMIVETILVLLVYPLFVFNWRHLLVIKRLKRIFDNIQKSAETHKDKIRKYGIIGLFAFVWFPFWMTGPVIGCVIGFMMGLRVWINIPVVLAGTYVAIIVWGLVLRQFHDIIAAYSTQAAKVVMILLIVIIVAGGFLHRILRKNKNRR